MDEVDPEMREMFEKLGISLGEQERLSGVAVDAIVDSVSVATTFKEKLGRCRGHLLPLLGGCSELPGPGASIPRLGGTYFITILIAAPLALITGQRTSGAWPKNAEKLNKIYPMEVARAVHLPGMFYYVAFIIVHVTLVLATGAMNNLNHMYAARDDASWVGFWIFAASVVVMIGAWFVARPIFLRPIASLTGSVSRR